MSAELKSELSAPLASSDQNVAGPPPGLFEQKEIDTFDRDDATAGTAIGRMLALFFIYTVVVMTISAIWTWRSLFGN